MWCSKLRELIDIHGKSWTNFSHIHLDRNLTASITPQRKMCKRILGKLVHFMPSTSGCSNLVTYQGNLWNFLQMCHSEPGPEAVEITTVASPQVPQSDLPSKRHNNKRTLTTEFIILTDNIPNQNSNNSSRKPDKSPNQERAMRKSPFELILGPKLKL